MKTLAREYRWTLTLIALCGTLAFAAAGCKESRPRQAENPPPKPVTAPPPAGQVNAPAAKGDTVFVEYTGKLENGEVFDSTAKHGGEPMKVVIGQTPLITGFTKGLIGMKVGETKTLTIPPEEAYGQAGESNHRLAGKTLIFEVKVVRMVKKGR